MGMKRTGDWNKLKQKMGSNFGARLALELRKATTKNAIILVRAIKKGIISQAPGGQMFQALSPSTIANKGSSKALIDEGYLINAITQKIMDDKAIVGLMRGATNKRGEDLVNIGAVMEFGATIRMPNGTVIVIPARPFLHPVFDAMRGEMVGNYREAIRKAVA